MAFHREGQRTTSVLRPGALRIYRALLLAYPAEFRHEYAGEMERLFEERLAAEPPIGLWLAVLADVAITAPREHLHILAADRSEEHTSELQSPCNLVCRLLLEKK